LNRKFSRLTPRTFAAFKKSVGVPEQELLENLLLGCWSEGPSEGDGSFLKAIYKESEIEPKKSL
jgi:hypothetical protein